eukprot:TRINITY_DN16332_c0_g1_i1.p1 TRINITY_DN16332_c0_g1~~TRINITY_DN16332_c0_g1_i1.p1  ORF type:complete len:974 (+),score=217.46 TRINITY_DN16332_c0_g1_i1:78-2924(+)
MGRRQRQGGAVRAAAAPRCRSHRGRGAPRCVLLALLVAAAFQLAAAAVTSTSTFTMTIPTGTATATETFTLPTQTFTLPTASVTSTDTFTLPSLSSTDTYTFTLPTLTITKATVTLPTSTITATTTFTIPTATDTATFAPSTTVTVTETMTSTESETETMTMTSSVTLPSASVSMTLPIVTVTHTATRTATVTRDRTDTISLPLGPPPPFPPPPPSPPPPVTWPPETPAPPGQQNAHRAVNIIIFRIITPLTVDRINHITNTQTLAFIKTALGLLWQPVNVRVCRTLWPWRLLDRVYCWNKNTEGVPTVGHPADRRLRALQEPVTAQPGEQWELEIMTEPQSPAFQESVINSRHLEIQALYQVEAASTVYVFNSTDSSSASRKVVVPAPPPPPAFAPPPPSPPPLSAVPPPPPVAGASRQYSANQGINANVGGAVGIGAQAVQLLGAASPSTLYQPNAPAVLRTDAAGGADWTYAGTTVTAVTAGSAAAAAGLGPGSEITHVNGVAVRSAADIAAQIAAAGSTGFYTVTTGAALTRSSTGNLGWAVDGTNTVTSVDAGSAAAAAGLSVGDVITHVNGNAVSTQAQLQAQLAAVANGARYTINKRQSPPKGCSAHEFNSLWLRCSCILSGDINSLPYTDSAAFASVFRSAVVAWLRSSGVSVTEANLVELAPRAGSVIVDFTITDGVATSPPTLAPTVRSADDDGSMTTTLIILIVLGCVLCCVLCIVFICYVMRRRDTGRSDREALAQERELAHAGKRSMGAGSDAAPGQHQSPYGSQPQPSPYDAQPLSRGAPGSAGEWQVGESVEAQYLDGMWHPGRVAAYDPVSRTYGIDWADGSYSQDIPGTQIRLPGHGAHSAGSYEYSEMGLQGTHGATSRPYGAPDAGPVFEPKVGDAIDAVWTEGGERQWHPGTVQAADSAAGACTVRWADGTITEGVPFADVRPADVQH